MKLYKHRSPLILYDSREVTPCSRRYEELVIIFTASIASWYALLAAICVYFVLCNRDDVVKK